MKPIKPVREQKKPGVLSQADLYSQVKDSTERNRQFFFIWIAFALYVIVTTVATTDLQLLLPYSTVTLPALGIQLPLIGFFLVTPWLVLILHFNLLQNLDSHANKLMQWANTYPNQTPPRAALPAFLFDFAMLEQGGAFTKLTQVATQLVFYAAGPLTIAILVWRFSDYQSWQYTVSQCLAFALGFVLVLKAIRALHFKYRLKTGISYLINFLIYLPILGLVYAQTYMVIALAIQNGKPALFDERMPQVWLPKISIPSNTSLINFPSDIQARMALDREENINDWWRKYGVGANLANRNLKYAFLSGVDLRKVNFKDAQLQGASLSFSLLQGANFSTAKLQSTSFYKTQLQGADFSLAELQGANLRSAQLEGANLKWSQMQGVDLRETNIDANTIFTYSQTDLETKVFVMELLKTNLLPPNYFGINSSKTFALREQLRDVNELRLPDILYQQLFGSSREYLIKNSAGKSETLTDVGQRKTPNK